MSGHNERPRGRKRRNRRRAGDNQTPGERLNFDILDQDEHCHIRGNRDALEKADRILLSFTGIGHGMGGIDVQNLEFVGTTSRQGAPVFITDLNRSWGNELDFERIAEVLEPYLRGKEVVSLGNSMGGFLSILASSFLPIKTAIAMNPQFSVDPKIVPDEHRWMRYRRGIKQFRYESLEGHFHSTTRYYALFGEAPAEEVHYSKFPKAKNVSVLVFPGQDHSLANWLNRQDAMETIISRCIADELNLNAIRKETGVEISRRGAAQRSQTHESAPTALSRLLRWRPRRR